MHAHRHLRAGAVRSPRPVGREDDERPALELRQHAVEHAQRRCLQESPSGGRDRAKRLGHGRTDPSPGTNGGLWWNGTRLRKSRSCLPVDARGNAERRQRIADQKPHELAVGELAAAAVQDSGQRPTPVLLHVNPHPDLVLRMGERPRVVLVEPEERRYVELLRVLVLERRPTQDLGQPLAEGVVELGDDA